MSRYIDVDTLIVDINKSIFNADDKEWYLTLLANAPNIDIVRCKECRHWNALDISRPSPCSVGLEDAKADDFCSYGERKD